MIQAILEHLKEQGLALTIGHGQDILYLNYKSRTHTLYTIGTLLAITTITPDTKTILKNIDLNHPNSLDQLDNHINNPTDTSNNQT